MQDADNMIIYLYKNTMWNKIAFAFIFNFHMQLFNSH